LKEEEKAEIINCLKNGTYPPSLEKIVKGKRHLSNFAKN
jgi:hypothetical protein